MCMPEGTAMAYTDNITSKCLTPYLATLSIQFLTVFRGFLRKQNLGMEKFCCSIDRVPASTSAGTLRLVLASRGEYTPEITMTYFAHILILFPLPIFLVVPIHTIHCTTSAPHLSIQAKHQFQAPSWILDTLPQNWKPSNSLLLGGLVHVKKIGNLAAKETFNLIPGCKSKSFAWLLKQVTISEIFSPKVTVDLSTGKTLTQKKKCFGKTANSQVSAHEESARLPP